MKIRKEKKNQTRIRKKTQKKFGINLHMTRLGSSSSTTRDRLTILFYTAGFALHNHTRAIRNTPHLHKCFVSSSSPRLTTYYRFVSFVTQVVICGVSGSVFTSATVRACCVCVRCRALRFLVGRTHKTDKTGALHLVWHF